MSTHLSPVRAIANSLALHRAQLEAFTRPATDLIVREVRAAGELVDLASGTGDPALALAAAQPSGCVIASDRSRELLAVTAEEAHARGLANLRTLQMDMHDMPLPAASADAVTSRLGLPFARDTRQVLAEILRVLRPGGVTCHVVWGAVDQPLLRELLPEVSPLRLGEPGPFQFSEPGTLKRAFADAGFADVRKETHRADWVWHGDARSFWTFMQETSGDRVSSTQRLAAFERDGALVFSVEVHWVCARKKSSA